MSQNSTAFDGMLVGVASWLHNGQSYPFPALLQHACHMLAFHLTAVPYPRTMPGLLHLMQEPVGTWYPLPLPPEFDADYGLVAHGRLSEEASRYLHQDLFDGQRISHEAESTIQTIAIENVQFRRLFERLRLAYEDDPERAQKDYVQLRRFLIEHPFATTDQIRESFWDAVYLRVEQVGGLYGNDLAEGQLYWICDKCGPLVEQRGRLYGVNHRACADHLPSSEHVRHVPWRYGLRRISPGIHWRVCLPGIPEIHLFHTLDALRQHNPDHLVDVTLWPGLDRYDIRVEFADGSVWAVDVKDHGSPETLSRHLTPIYCEGMLRHDRGFYVVPSRRLSQENYFRIAMACPHRLLSTDSLVSDTMFETAVVEYIHKLQEKT